MRAELRERKIPRCRVITGAWIRVPLCGRRLCRRVNRGDSGAFNFKIIKYEGGVRACIPDYKGMGSIRKTARVPESIFVVCLAMNSPIPSRLHAIQNEAGVKMGTGDLDRRVGTKYCD